MTELSAAGAAHDASRGPALLSADARAGARDMLPMMVAYVPFGLLVGAAVGSSANPLAAWLSTWTIYGGAAHLAVLDMLGHGSGWVAAAVVGLLVNVRLTAYATAMSPEWRDAPVWQRVAAALTLTDAPWALTRNRTTGKRRYYAGAAFTVWLLWPTFVTVGALAGDWVTSVPVAGLLSAMTLGAVVATQLRQRPVAAAAAAATVCTVATNGLPPGVALVLTGVVGAAAGLLADRPAPAAGLRPAQDEEEVEAA